MSDPRTPVIVGVSQIVQRPERDDLADARGPIELMAEAARAAADDAGAGSLLGRVGQISVAGGWWRYRNPGALVAELVGASGAASVLSSVSGTGPQDLVASAAERIAQGRLDVALVLGGEARWTHQRLKRAGIEPPWITDPGEGDPETASAFPDTLVEESLRLGRAPTAYALFEDRLRTAAGRSIDEQRDVAAGLWARFSDVAATNPYAWDRRAHTADEIRTATPDNRMISSPYTKAMVANNTVDMASAILLCSREVADAASIPADRRIHPHVVTSSHETWLVVERGELHGCPALTTAGRTAFELAGIGPDDVDHVDLYACFPSIVQMSTGALGITHDRPLTVTGGLGFAGAPVGNAVGHSIAAMVDRLRADGGVGMVHANGGSATKHAFGIYAPDPPEVFRWVDVQDRVDHGACVAAPDDRAGEVRVEAATVNHGREGPERLVAAVRFDDDSRAWGFSDDPDLLAVAEHEGIAGRTGRRSGDATLEL